jgi:hypothetical protein
MYIRKASRTYKGKTYSNYLLVESLLTPKGPRQKIICSLGDLSPAPDRIGSPWPTNSSPLFPDSKSRRRR